MNHVILLSQELLAIYGIILIGYFAKRTNILNSQADHVLTQLILYITLPALILFSMDFPFSTAYLLSFGQLLGLSGFALLIACIIGYFMGKYSTLQGQTKGIYQSLIIFGNQGFIGYAISYIVFQEIGIVFAGIFNLFYLILIWTYCPYLIGQNKILFNWKTVLLNPGILATSIGLLLWIFPFQCPALLLKTIEGIGKMTIPLSMILIGGLLANLHRKQLSYYFRNPYIWYACIAKLIIIPLLFLCSSLILQISYQILAVSVLITACPSAPTTTLFAQKYNGDVYFATVGVFLSTIFALVTIPIFFYMLASIM